MRRRDARPDLDIYSAATREILAGWLMTPAQMDEELPAQLKLLNGLAPRLIHYKVCATFDSSPRIGSIGHAADIAFDVGLIAAVEADHAVSFIPTLGIDRLVRRNRV